MLTRRKPLQGKSLLRREKPLAKVRKHRGERWNVEPTAEQGRFHESLRHLPCQCGCGLPSECRHHILANIPGKTRKRDHWLIVRLTNDCHNGAKDSVHMLGSERLFKERRGVDLIAIAIANRAAWEEARRG